MGNTRLACIVRRLNNYTVAGSRKTTRQLVLVTIAVQRFERVEHVAMNRMHVEFNSRHIVERQTFLNLAHPPVAVRVAVAASTNSGRLPIVHAAHDAFVETNTIAGCGVVSGLELTQFVALVPVATSGCGVVDTAGGSERTHKATQCSCSQTHKKGVCVHTQQQSGREEPTQAGNALGS